MLLIVDTETTDLENPKVVEIAVGHINDASEMDKILITVETYRPSVPISTKAMSVHGITNEMVAGFPEFIGSGMYNDLMATNTKDNVFIAHNAPFDISVLKNEGIDIQMRVIDTLKCCKHIFKDNPNVETNLSYLKYHLSLYKEEIPEQIADISKHGAHSASGDVLTLYLMVRRLFAKYSIDELEKMSVSPICYNTMPFGKHKGKPIKEICATDKSYANWVFNKCDDEDVKYSFMCHSKKK